MTFMLTSWMLYAMWVVLGLMGINLLLGLYRSIRDGAFHHTLILGYLQDLLYYVLPLILLANLMVIDPTGWLVLIGYYAGVLGIALKYLHDIKSNL